jgi:hypothetical protein
MPKKIINLTVTLRYFQFIFFPYGRAAESFWGRVPELSITFEEILPRAHGNFETQNKVLESSIIINQCIIIINSRYIINAGRRPLGRPRRRWVDNIRMDLQEVGCGYMDWIGLAQDREW